jgi:hypothetical protein
MLTLFVAATVPAVAQEVPSDDQIISAISVYWDDGNNRTIAALQSQIRSATVEADKNQYEAKAKAASARCPSDPCKKCEREIRDNPICFEKKNDVSFFFTHIFLGADGLAKCVAEARGECLAEAEGDWGYTVKKIKQWKEEIQDLTSRSTSARAKADNRVFSVVKRITMKATSSATSI